MNIISHSTMYSSGHDSFPFHKTCSSFFIKSLLKNVEWIVWKEYEKSSYINNVNVSPYSQFHFFCNSFFSILSCHTHIFFIITRFSMYNIDLRNEKSCKNTFYSIFINWQRTFFLLLSSYIHNVSMKERWEVSRFFCY